VRPYFAQLLIRWLLADTASGDRQPRPAPAPSDSPCNPLTNRTTRYALFDINKLESAAIKPEPSDLTVAALFRELRGDFEGIAANEVLRLQIEECINCVYSDPSLVEQLLRNLLSNSGRYLLGGQKAASRSAPGGREQTSQCRRAIDATQSAANNLRVVDGSAINPAINRQGCVHFHSNIKIKKED